MSRTEIRDDRVAGASRPSATVKRPAAASSTSSWSRPRALVPVRTIVEPAREGRAPPGALARELYVIAEREGAPVAPLCRTSCSGPHATPGRLRRPTRSCCRPAAKDWLRACPGRQRAPTWDDRTAGAVLSGRHVSRAGGGLCAGGVPQRPRWVLCAGGPSSCRRQAPRRQPVSGPAAVLSRRRSLLRGRPPARTPSGAAVG
ncbi:hypothetical protein LT493_24450 [Streptomyces tricolor]|nr:hypothetical protein [Streptomyces tricolor]